MAVHIQSKGIDGEGYASEYIPPVTRGLAGIFFTNTDLNKCKNNYAEDKKDGTVAGVPVPTPSHLSCKGLTNFIQTDIMETESLTMFIVDRAVGLSGPTPPPTAEVTISIGNYNTVLDPGTGAFLYHSINDRMSGGAGYIDTATGLNTNKVASVIGINTSVFALYSVTVSPSDVTTRSFTHNLKTTQVAPGPRNLSTSRAMRIGSAYGANQLGLCDTMVALLYTVALTQSEQDLIAADIRAYCARKGVTV